MQSLRNHPPWKNLLLFPLSLFPQINENPISLPPKMSSSSSAATAASTGGAGIAGGGADSGSSGYFLQNLSNLGLGYTIAITLGFLLLLSTILLASYVCCRASRNRLRSPNSGNLDSNSNPSNYNGIMLPRVFFVAEDDNDEENVVGLDYSIINSCPKFPFCKSKDLGSGDCMCSICLCDYKDGEMVRMMPDCRHFFHVSCIDAWLRLNASCPVCRTSPLPTPSSTPLSELVPLSHYPGNRRRWRFVGWDGLLLIDFAFLLTCLFVSCKFWVVSSCFIGRLKLCFVSFIWFCDCIWCWS